MNDTYLKNLLGDKEEILLIARQHWLMLLGETASEVILALALSALLAILAVFLGPFVLIGLALLLLPAASFTRDLLIWMNRMYVITSRRVIQVSGVLSKNVNDSSLEKVNDVKLEQSLFGRVFDYGDIEILTASELGVNRISQIAHPIRYKTTMVNAKARLEANGSASASSGGDIPALLTQLDLLRQKGILTGEEFIEKKAKLLSKL